MTPRARKPPVPDAPEPTPSREVPGADPAPPAWTVYVLASQRLARTYVGISPDPERRLAQHNGQAPGGASSTRAGRPWRLATTYGPYPTRAEAQRVEADVKRLTGPARFAWDPERPS